jgi:Transglutaminase-like superfamily
MNASESTPMKAEVSTDRGTAHEMGAKPVSRLKRFAGLGRPEQVLLLRALYLVCAIRVGLFLLPFRVLQSFAQRGTKKANAVHSADRYVWAIRAVSRCVPGATCLTQALAAQALLARSGHKSHIEIGVRKNEQRQFLAHAWVVCGDQIIIGGAEADNYIPLEAFKSKTAWMDKT